MVAVRGPQYVPYPDFLAMENESEDKHEWVDGAVYTMIRGGPEHARLTFNVSKALLPLENDCAGFAASAAIFIEAAQMHTYADASLVCGPLVTRTVHDKNGQSIGEAIVNPTVIVEVLSDATERYDRDAKFEAYKKLPSLEQYVLVSQKEPRIEVRSRRPGRKSQTWSVVIATQGEKVMIHGREIAVDDVYGGPEAPRKPKKKTTSRRS